MALAERGAQRGAVTIAVIQIFLSALLYADTIYLKNQTVVSARRAWEEGDEIKYETAEGVKSLPKSAVLKIHHREPVIVERVPVQPTSPPAVDVLPASKPLAVPLPSPVRSGDPPTSPEEIERLRARVEKEPTNPQVRSDLVSALNAHAAMLNIRGEHEAAITALRRALTYAPKHLTSLTNLAGVQYEIGDYRGAEETLQQAETLNDQDQYVHYLLGEVYYAQDKLDRATRAWGQALKVASDPKIKAHLQQRLSRAGREGDRQKALNQLTSQHFILRYDRQVADYRLGQNILDRMERLYEQLTFKLMSSPPQTITVILYTREAFFDITRAPHWSGALYDGKIKVPIKGLTEVDERLSAVLVHELAHAFIALATRRNCPAWLNEGIAQWSEGRRTTAEKQRLLAGLHRRKELPSLGQLDRPFSGLSASTAKVAYAEALSAVEFLVRLGRSEAMLKKLLEPLRSGMDIDAALKQTIGYTAAAFEKAWTDHLEAQD